MADLTGIPDAVTEQINGLLHDLAGADLRVEITRDLRDQRLQEFEQADAALGDASDQARAAVDERDKLASRLRAELWQAGLVLTATGLERK